MNPNKQRWCLGKKIIVGSKGSRLKNKNGRGGQEKEAFLSFFKRRLLLSFFLACLLPCFLASFLPSFSFSFQICFLIPICFLILICFLIPICFFLIPLPNCCLSVKIVPSCRDIGEMQWNRCHPCHHDIELAIVESFTAFLHGVLDSFGYHGTEPLLVHFCIFYGSIATMFAHLCLQLRSSTASWYRAYFVSQRADALHWIVRWTWTALRKWAAISGAICTMVLSLVLCDFLAFPLQLTMFAHLCLQLRSPSGAALCERLCVKVLVEASVCKSVCVWKCLHVNVPVCKSVCV